MNQPATAALSAPQLFPRYIWWGALVGCVICGAGAALSIWPLALVPVAAGITLISVLRPEWGLILLASSLFYPVRFITEPNLTLADVFTFLILIGYFLTELSRGRSPFKSLPLAQPAIAWLIVMAASLFLVRFSSLGAVNWFRHVQLLLLIYAVAGLCRRIDTRWVVYAFIFWCCAYGLGNIAGFIQTGGSVRTFGIPRIGFSAALVVSSVYVLARFCYAVSLRRAVVFFIIYVILLAALFATISRAPIAVAGIGNLLVLILVYRGTRKHGFAIPRRRVRFIIIFGLCATAVAATLLMPMFTTLAERFAGVGNAGASLRYRYFIWGTSLDLFRQHPLLGIGLGQVQIWHQAFPELRLHPLGPITFGLGTHLTFLKYVVETGVIGAGIFLWFLGALWRVAARNIARENRLQSMGHVLGISAVVFTVIIRMFIEGIAFHGIAGITECLFYGMAMGLYQSRYV